MHNGLIQRMLKQVAVYWAPAGVDRKGQQTFAAAVEVPCRWDEQTEQFLDHNGNVALSKAKVYVGVDVQELGAVWLSSATADDPAGTALAQLTSPTSPFANTGVGGKKAMEVRRFERFPNARNDNYLRTVYV